MLPFGKQKENLHFLSTTNPEELLGNRRDTVHHCTHGGESNPHDSI